MKVQIHYEIPKLEGISKKKFVKLKIFLDEIQKNDYEIQFALCSQIRNCTVDMLACVMDTYSNGKDNQISNNLWIDRTTNCAAPAEGANNESACKGAKIAYGLFGRS